MGKTAAVPARVTQGGCPGRICCAPSGQEQEKRNIKKRRQRLRGRLDFVLDRSPSEPIVGPTEGCVEISGKNLERSSPSLHS